MPFILCVLDRGPHPIQAIKLVRSTADVGLLEAKQAVEQMRPLLIPDKKVNRTRMHLTAGRAKFLLLPAVQALDKLLPAAMAWRNANNKELLTRDVDRALYEVIDDIDPPKGNRYAALMKESEEL